MKECSPSPRSKGISAGTIVHGKKVSTTTSTPVRIGAGEIYTVRYISEDAVVLHIKSINGTDYGDKAMTRADFDNAYEICWCSR